MSHFASHQGKKSRQLFTHLSRKNTLPRQIRLSLERLEARTLLSAVPALDGIAARPMLTLEPEAFSAAPSGLTPSQVRSFYGVDKIHFAGGAVQGDGAGQTIAIVDAYDNPNIAQDLTAFDRQFGLPAPPSFTKVYASSFRPRTDARWSEEIALDVEWAHAIAPKANIVLVEANSAQLGDLLAAVDVARHMPGVSVISMSWGCNEFAGETSYDSYFTTPPGHAPITFVGASGDSGAPGIWPAVSSNVLAVGGTTIHGSGVSAWESGWSGSGGGYSRYESEPAYQRSVQNTGARSSPDVAYNADPSSGFAVYDTVGHRGWITVGGTSAGAPQWAAILAIADQGLRLAGKGPIGQAQQEIYKLSSRDFHDVASGSNGYTVGAGYDLVTGRGTPIANLLVSDLVSGALGGTAGAGGARGGSTGGSTGGTTGSTTGGGTTGGTTGSGGTSSSGGAHGGWGAGWGASWDSARGSWNPWSSFGFSGGTRYASLSKPRGGNAYASPKAFSLSAVDAYFAEASRR